MNPRAIRPFPILGHLYMYIHTVEGVFILGLNPTNQQICAIPNVDLYAARATLHFPVLPPAVGVAIGVSLVSTETVGSEADNGPDGRDD